MRRYKLFSSKEVVVMTEDLEIKAMSQIAAALVDLDDDARGRVLDWAAKRFSVAFVQQRGASTGARDSGSGGGTNGSESHEFSVFADLFDTTNPKPEADRALVGGYWFQEVLGQADFGSQSVNDALKDVGHGVSNITSALDKLQSRKPALIRQVAKAGRTRQARKKYKLTTAGISAVRAMMSGAAAAEDGV
jgi:hypothetical protein